MTADTMVRAGRTGVSTAFGTFGELLQGVLPERDGDFLVTLPIARWAMASYQVDHGAGNFVANPAHKVKARRLVRMITDSVGVHAGGLLTITSRIEEGKGLASSSADLVATARAVGNALGIEMPPRRIESYLRRVEPTDGVLYPGIVAYHHRRVRRRRPLGSLPVMAVVAIDEGGGKRSSSTGYPSRSRRRSAGSTPGCSTGCRTRWRRATWPWSARSRPAARS